MKLSPFLIKIILFLESNNSLFTYFIVTLKFIAFDKKIIQIIKTK
ncbi:putative membrane protein [Candidatus Phytoplasma solani]